MTFEKQVVQIANLGIYHIVTGRPMTSPLIPSSDMRWKERSGAFVTIKAAGKIRGSIGMLESSTDLQETLFDLGTAVATHDSRFPPLTESELKELETQVSFLCSFKIITKLEEVEVGRHGLIISRGEKRAVLLPDVPAKFGWNAEQFLEACCEKAELSHKAWRDPNTLVETFESHSFSAKDYWESIREYVVPKIDLKLQ